MTTAAQLALSLPFAARCTFDDYVVGQNVELLTRLGRWRQEPGGSAVWIHGEPHTGRSHLLQAACAAFARADTPVGYLPATLVATGPEVLAGLGSLALVALDDLEHWLGTRGMEEALLVLHRSLLRAGGKLLLASAGAPLEHRFVLDDLGSRLRAAESYRIVPLDDAGKARVVLSSASRRGLEVPPEVMRYLFTRGPRDLPGLLSAVEMLDRASIAAQRRLTLPLARGVLGL